VVRIEDGLAWFEPEQTTSCGHCASAGQCGAKGIGTLASRVELRRFRLDDAIGLGLGVGERVVVGVDERSLLRASLTAYALPLLAALAIGALVQALFASDLATLMSMASGLAVGLLAAGRVARRLAARGELEPRFLRRAQTAETTEAAETASAVWSRS
jgi:sigma-E factor negative regulatory protein RseC